MAPSVRFCFGQKNGGPSGCREPYTPADRLEDQVAKLYRRLQLPDTVIDKLLADMQAEILTASTATPASASSRRAS